MSRWKEETALERFERLIDKRGPDECWPWIGGVTHGGYGRFYLADGVYVGSNRAAWLLYVGPIRADMHVCHRCDNPPCCNPAHLFVGTRSDNMTDAATKGRIPGPRLAGERNPAAILSADDVRQIRDRRASGETLRSLSSAFGVSQSTVSAIAHGRLWAGVR